MTYVTKISRVLTPPSQSEASPAILALIAQGDSSNIAENKLEASRDKNSLIALRALIDSKLGAFKEKLPEVVAEAQKANDTAADLKAMRDHDLYYDGDVRSQENGGDTDTLMSDEVEG